MINIDVSRYRDTPVLDEIEENRYPDADHSAVAMSLSAQLKEAITYQAIVRQHSPTLQCRSFTSSRWNRRQIPTE